MNVKFITLTAAKFAAAATYKASKYQGIFVHLTEPVLKGGEGDDKDDVVTPAGLYFGGTNGWEMLSNDTDVAAIQEAIENAIDALDTTADVVTASVADGVVTLTAGIAQEDGIIKKGASTDIVLAKVATTGAAKDITFAQYPAELGTDETAKIASGANLQEVMEAVIDSINEANEDAVLALYDKDGNALKADAATVKADGTTYTLKQGTGDDAKVVAKFNIVKDSFVKEGSIVYGTLAGGEFTEADAAKDGSNTYIKLVFATNDGSGTVEVGTPIYIPAASLVEYSSVAEGDLYLTSNDDHVISVTDKVKNAITKVEGLTVNDKKVADDGTVTIDADDIEYEAAVPAVGVEGEDGYVPAKEAVSVKDALDNLGKDAYAGVVEDEDNNSEYVTISDIDENNQQTLSVKIGSFTVPEVKDEDGKTVEGTGVAQVPGLATVEAVEKIITDNEEVTAAALNDLNDRVEVLENADAVVTTVAGDDAAALSNTGVNVVVKVADNKAEDSNDHDYKVSATAEMVWLTELPA